MTRWPLCRVTIILSQNDGDCGLTFAVFFVGGPPLGRVEDTPTIVSHLKIRCNSSPNRKLASPSNPASEVQSLLDGPEETILDFVFTAFWRSFYVSFFTKGSFLKIRPSRMKLELMAWELEGLEWRAYPYSEACCAWVSVPWMRNTGYRLPRQPGPVLP